jgi:ribosomal protein L12E/L44/L45/RPP1/RPP2
MPGLRYTPAEETFLRSRIGDMLQQGQSIDVISQTLKIPRSTVGLKVKHLRMEALSRHEEYYQSLPLELENSLANLSSVWIMALELYRDPNARMSYASRINLIATLKNLVETRIAILSDMSIIKDIATYTEQQRIRLEKLQKQSVKEIDTETRTIDEMMQAGQISIKDLAIAASNQKQRQGKQEQTMDKSEAESEEEDKEQPEPSDSIE